MAHDLQGLQALGLRLAQAGDLQTVRDQSGPPFASHPDQVRCQSPIPGAAKRSCHTDRKSR